MSPRAKTWCSAAIIVTGAVTSVAAGMAARTDDECAQTPECEAEGHCTSWLGWCVVGSDVDCRISKACQAERRCQVREGACVREDTRH